MMAAEPRRCRSSCCFYHVVLPDCQTDACLYLWDWPWKIGSESSPAESEAFLKEFTRQSRLGLMHANSRTKSGRYLPPLLCFGASGLREDCTARAFLCCDSHCPTLACLCESSGPSSRVEVRAGSPRPRRQRRRRHHDQHLRHRHLRDAITYSILQ